MAHEAAERAPTQVILPPGRLPLPDLAELWRFRDLVLALAVRNLKVRYKQTVLGVIWVVLQPLLGAAILTFVFGRIARLPAGGVPYVLSAFAGMAGWTLFSGTLTDASASLLANAQLVTKVYFPRLALPLSTILQQLVNLVVTLAVMGVLCAIYRVSPAGRVVLLPVWLAGILAFAIGLGLIFGALMVRYRDVRYVLPMLVQMLLYASPVGYTLAALQERVSPLLRRLYLLNPLAGLLEAVRWSLLPVGTLPVPAVTYALAASLVTLLAGVFFFVWAERRFADVI